MTFCSPERATQRTLIEGHVIIDDDLDIRSLVRQYSHLPLGRIRLLEDYTNFRPGDIGLAAVFLVAPWNDRSLQALSEITQAMFEFPPCAFDFYAARLEGIPLSLLREAFHRSWIQGSGETIWIRGGEIFDSRTCYPEGKAGEVFVEVTRRMLKDLGF